MTDDVVAELDAELALIEPLPYRVPIHHLAQRARDEIVALRKLTDGNWVWQQIRSTRDEALEEAAQVCEAIPGDINYGLAANSIRALKNKSEPQS